MVFGIDLDLEYTWSKALWHLWLEPDLRLIECLVFQFIFIVLFVVNLSSFVTILSFTSTREKSAKKAFRWHWSMAFTLGILPLGILLTVASFVLAVYQQNGRHWDLKHTHCQIVVVTLTVFAICLPFVIYFTVISYMSWNTFVRRRLKKFKIIVSNTNKSKTKMVSWHNISTGSKDADLDMLYLVATVKPTVQLLQQQLQQMQNKKIKKKQQQKQGEQKSFNNIYGDGSHKHVEQKLKPPAMELFDEVTNQLIPETETESELGLNASEVVSSSVVHNGSSSSNGNMHGDFDDGLLIADGGLLSEDTDSVSSSSLLSFPTGNSQTRWKMQMHSASRVPVMSSSIAHNNNNNSNSRGDDGSGSAAGNGDSTHVADTDTAGYLATDAQIKEPSDFGGPLKAVNIIIMAYQARWMLFLFLFVTQCALFVLIQIKNYHEEQAALLRWAYRFSRVVDENDLAMARWELENNIPIDPSETFESLEWVEYHAKMAAAQL